MYGPALPPRRLTFEPGQQIGPVRVHQEVPAHAPPGVYTYRVFFGSYPAGGASASFTFRKRAPGLRGSGPGVAAWRAEVVRESPVAAAATPPRLPAAPPDAPVVQPNPAGHRATLAFALAAPAETHLVLFDLLGRRVAEEDAGLLVSGPHRITLEVPPVLPAGVYLWRLTAGARVESGRLTVVR